MSDRLFLLIGTRSGTWSFENDALTTVAIDESFASCTSIISTAFWFYNCVALTDINGIENLNTSSVTDMRGMFAGCSHLASLNLSRFDTQNVTDMGWLFFGCSDLETIHVGNRWNTESVDSVWDNGQYLTLGYDMFAGCTNLVGGKGTTYDANHTDAEYARIDGGPNSDTPGYFTDKNAPIIVHHELTITTTGNGSATYDGTQVRNTTTAFSVVEGSTAKIAVEPDPNNHLEQVLVNGTAAQVVNDTLTISNIVDSTGVKITFVPTAVYQYDLAVAVSTQETITAGGKATILVTVVNEGENDADGYTVKVTAGDLLLLEQTVTEALAPFKKQVIEKQTMEVENFNLYSYMHDIFGAEVIEIFDMTYIKAESGSYVIWSYREKMGTEYDTGSMLYIASIDEKEPWKLTSEPVLLTRPLYGWENVSGTINNEGPYAFLKDGKVYVTYSGGAANGYTYVLGLFTADEDKNLLDMSNWTKSKTSVLNFYSVKGEYGPGHNSFFTNEDGEMMIAYHGETELHSNLRCDGIRRVHFRANGTPYFQMSADEDLQDTEVSMRVVVK